MKTRRALVAFILAAPVAGIACLLRFPPERYTFYPRCPIHEYLHLLCPGCGATRALAALLHGHLSDAQHLNALFVALLPLITVYGALCCYRAWQADTFHWPTLPPWVASTGLAVAVLFTITRNLPA